MNALEILNLGPVAWNSWRAEFPVRWKGAEPLPETIPDLSGINLSGRNLNRFDFRNCLLDLASFDGAQLRETQFCHASLRDTSLRCADLHRADFFGTDLSGADLSDSNLQYSIFVQTIVYDAVFTNCAIYGISVWQLVGNPKLSRDLRMIIDTGIEMTVDNLQTAQFLHMFFDNAQIREAIDTMSSRVVLILGRFEPERKEILDDLRCSLRSYNLAPVLFDFTRPDSRDHIETVSTLAHLAKYVFADFTNPKVVLEEVPHIARTVNVAIKPLLQQGAEEPVTLLDLRRRNRCICGTFVYRDKQHLIDNLDVVLGQIEKTRQDISTPTAANQAAHSDT